MPTRIMTYNEFFVQHVKYDGHDKCFVAGCNQPAYFEGGDARCYCGMCEEHYGIKENYRRYLEDVERKLKIRALWSKRDAEIQSRLVEVANRLAEFEKGEKA